MGKAPRPSVRLKVKVVPRSSRDGIVGWPEDALKIKVKRLGLNTDAVAVVGGHSSASKVIAINGMDEESIKKTP
jgi:uncharacterized protein YggU (UPF0235/DUF167 family)